MSAFDIVLTSLSGLAALYGLFSLWLAARVIRAVPVLAQVTAAEPARWPRVSQIIPARNEQDDVEAAVRSRLAENYPDTELILINDRSTDASGAIMDRLAGDDDRIRVLHIHELPPGWLGKVHAMHQGLQQATGEWLLFSDADVHLLPGALRQSLKLAEVRGLDHIAVFPELWSSTFLLDTVLASFGRVFLFGTRCWAVPKQKSSAAIGVGAFNLVRRSAYERTPGLEWLKLEVVDDYGLGQMLKDHGARCSAANGRGMVGLWWYRSVWEMARGGEKSIVAGVGGHRVNMVVFQALAFLLVEWLPFAALAIALAAPAPIAAVLSGIGVATLLAAQLMLARWMRRPLLAATLIPVGVLLSTCMSLWAAWMTFVRGGINWRGTGHTAEELRRGRRVRFP